MLHNPLEHGISGDAARHAERERGRESQRETKGYEPSREAQTIVAAEEGACSLPEAWGAFDATTQKATGREREARTACWVMHANGHQSEGYRESKLDLCLRFVPGNFVPCLDVTPNSHNCPFPPDFWGCRLVECFPGNIQLCTDANGHGCLLS